MAHVFYTGQQAQQGYIPLVQGTIPLTYYVPQQNISGYPYGVSPQNVVPMPPLTTGRTVIFYPKGDTVTEAIKLKEGQNTTRSTEGAITNDIK